MADPIPHEGRWGIYALDPATGAVSLIISFTRPIFNLRLNHAGDALAFSQQIDGEGNSFDEICTVFVDGTGFARLTNNSFFDLYPAWSPDDSRIAFLSWRSGDSTLELYRMDADGSDASEFYDSGSHDADVDWHGSTVVFTTGSRIWTVGIDGTGAEQLTDPPRAGRWGAANLPYGDYDPRFSPDGTRVVFSRMVDVSTSSGGYDIYVINADGTGENRLTTAGYAQGFPHWSSAGDEIILIVAAIGGEGRYDIYRMDADGSNVRNIVPAYFPDEFLCHIATFSSDDSLIYFIGEWWENE